MAAEQPVTRWLHDVVMRRQVVLVQVTTVELLAAELTLVTRGPLTFAAVPDHAPTVREHLAAVSALVTTSGS